MFFNIISLFIHFRKIENLIEYNKQLLCLNFKQTMYNIISITRKWKKMCTKKNEGHIYYLVGI